MCEVVYYARYLDLSVHIMHLCGCARTRTSCVCFIFPLKFRTFVGLSSVFFKILGSPARISCSRVRCLWCLYFALRSCVYVCASCLVRAILRRVHRLDECMQNVHTCFCAHCIVLTILTISLQIIYTPEAHSKRIEAG